VEARGEASPTWQLWSSTFAHVRHQHRIVLAQ